MHKVRTRTCWKYFGDGYLVIEKGRRCPSDVKRALSQGLRHPKKKQKGVSGVVGCFFCGGKGKASRVPFTRKFEHSSKRLRESDSEV